MLEVTRKPDRQSTERENLNAFLDEQWWGVLSVRREAPEPERDPGLSQEQSQRQGDHDPIPGVITIPTLFVRDSDRILVHGSTGAGTIGAKRGKKNGETSETGTSDGPSSPSGGPALLPVSFCVSAMDDLILAHSTLDSSVNYRSAVLYGHLESAEPADREALLSTFTDKLVPGRNAEVRAMSKKEIAATNVAVLKITDGQWVYKERSGDVGDPDEDTEAWGGVVPIITSYGEPRTASWATGRAIPPSVSRLRG